MSDPAMIATVIITTTVFCVLIGLSGGAGR